MRSSWWNLRLVLLVALVLRVAVAGLALARGTTDAWDTSSYIKPARALLATGRFDTNGAPELLRTPGYPLLLTVGEALGAVSPVTLALQALLGVLTVWLVARLALALGADRKVALLAAALYALEPLALAYTGKLLTETLFTAVYVGMLLALARWARGGHPGWLSAAALLLAAACFVRPVLLFAPLLMVVVVAAVAWRAHGRGWRALVHAAAFFALAVAPLMAWRARNAQAAGYPGFSAITDLDLYYYRAAGVVALRTGESLIDVQRSWRAARGDTLHAPGRAARGRERAAQYEDMRAEARAILVEDPGAVLRVTATGAMRTVLGPGTSDWVALAGPGLGSRERLVLSAFLAAYLLPVLLLSLVGLARGRGWSRAALVVTLATPLYLVAVTSGPGAYSRFRHPVMPVMCILAAGGAYALLRRRDARVPAVPERHPRVTSEALP